jgi:hypothetical protein
MASVYTTARGKNKKHKAKDASKNGAQCRTNKFDADFCRDLKSTLEGATLEEKAPAVASLASSAFRQRMEREGRLREQAETKCSCPTCPSLSLPRAMDGGGGSGDGGCGGGGGGGGGCGEDAVKPPVVVLQRCACHLAAYCCVECQRAHWADHKAICKAKRAEMAEVAVAKALALAKAEAEAKAAEEALLRELDATSRGGGSSGGRR